MPDREKLIELLRKVRYEYRRYIAMKDYEKRIAKTDEEFLAVDDSIVGEIPFCADYLIANGVTIQKWIPVAERLPENYTHILVTTDSVVVPAYWHNDRFYAFIANGVATVGGVTHWMPLPQPPKGE